MMARSEVGGCQVWVAHLVVCKPVVSGGRSGCFHGVLDFLHLRFFFLLLPCTVIIGLLLLLPIVLLPLSLSL